MRKKPQDVFTDIYSPLYIALWDALNNYEYARKVAPAKERFDEIRKEVFFDNHFPALFQTIENEIPTLWSKFCDYMNRRNPRTNLFFLEEEFPKNGSLDDQELFMERNREAENLATKIMCKEVGNVFYHITKEFRTKEMKFSKDKYDLRSYAEEKCRRCDFAIYSNGKYFFLNYDHQWRHADFAGLHVVERYDSGF